ncbi:hypothetical protein SSX86_000288 [Deinandra increscens subsp. villosa]|uniref:Leucine-rich repeat-containing protein n=1 Tax=Deinandra increscens subsp. villosa TaxID=3103831 RepID=A0AAP0DSV6_9ASTR
METKQPAMDLPAMETKPPPMDLPAMDPPTKIERRSNKILAQIGNRTKTPVKSPAPCISGDGISTSVALHLLHLLRRIWYVVGFCRGTLGWRWSFPCGVYFAGNKRGGSARPAKIPGRVLIRFLNKGFCFWPVKIIIPIAKYHVSKNQLLLIFGDRQRFGGRRREEGKNLVIPDSVAGLENLEELNVSSNILESLPDSIGCLLKLKILDVSSNKLDSLPDSIAQCRSLVELDASFNKLTYLPTKIGHELINLKKLSIQLNKVRNFPTSIGEMESLQFLDAHFNELRGLPKSIGKLSNLEVLNLGSNFSDLRELPDTIGDLVNLRELDVSNNQIQQLPLTFGRLEKLTKLNVDQNPLVVPPKEVVEEGIGAVKVYMAQRWFDMLVEEEEKSRREHEALAQASWLSRSTTWLAGAVVGAAGTVSLLMAGENDEPYLEEER